ncbi:DUF1707 domain-containing protein [Actinomadura sp. SCN-SB]|uniref:DUF1707 SHOCT-like domain-containing protein n=1 Tax=Actinomadura sp. SCN-SB TaxID=3373092 RepID=UPI00375324B5
MTSSPPPAGQERGSSSPYPPEMRASDADRDRVAEVLREAAGDGRLTLEELQERLNQVYMAKTYAELEPITRDLPSPGNRGDLAPYTPPFADAPAADPPSWWTGLAIMSGFRHEGRWTVPRLFTTFAFWGGGRLDLREARFAEPEVRIRAFAIMGGVEVIVPEDIAVRVNGIGIMGGFDHHASGPGVPGAPRVVISGLAFWGGVNVKRKPRKHARRLREGRDCRGELED